MTITHEAVQSLAAEGCTQEQIAAVFGVALIAIQTVYAEAYATGKNIGDAAIARKQYELAITGNRAMLIWLGKNRLGQSDKTEIKNQMQEINVVIGTPPQLADQPKGDTDAEI